MKITIFYYIIIAGEFEKKKGVNMSGKTSRSALSKWIFLPIALILIFMMIWGIWGQKLVVAPEQTQTKRSVTGVVSNLDTNTKTFTLTIEEELEEDEPSVWEVEYEKAKKFYAIKKTESAESTGSLISRADIVGLEFEHERAEITDSNLIADGITVTAIGRKKVKEGIFSASSIHFGGIFNAPEYHQRREPAEIYKTAVILCIACVGLGESNFFWFYLILGLLILVLLLWVMMRIIQKRGATA